MADFATMTTSWKVMRWDDEQTTWALGRLGLPGHVTLKPHHFAAVGVEPYSVTEDYNCNLVTLAGWAALLGSVGGTSITNKFSSTFGRIGVGTSTTAVTAADTKLGGDTGGGSTTSYYAVCGAGPTIVTSSAPATMQFSASFGPSVANFAWNEFGLDNYNTAGVTTQGLGASVIFFNHGLSSQGTKAGGTLTGTVTFTCGYPSGSGAVN